MFPIGRCSLYGSATPMKEGQMGKRLGPGAKRAPQAPQEEATSSNTGEDDSSTEDEGTEEEEDTEDEGEGSPSLFGRGGDG